MISRDTRTKRPPTPLPRGCSGAVRLLYSLGLIIHVRGTVHNRWLYKDVGCVTPWSTGFQVTDFAGEVTGCTSLPRALDRLAKLSRGTPTQRP